VLKTEKNPSKNHNPHLKVIHDTEDQEDYLKVIRGVEDRENPSRDHNPHSKIIYSAEDRERYLQCNNDM
jgi:hypothetical protein